MTKISDLPTDLVEDVLSRVPSKHMREVRLTCRKWESLSTSESFTKMRISREETREKEGESRMILLTNDNLYMMSIFVDENPSTKIKRKLISFDVEVKISLVFHCEGLLLCVLGNDKTRLVVWNPYSGQTRSIQLRYCYIPSMFPDLDRYGYALGYNKEKKAYKILRFLDDRVLDTRHYALWYEIYDFESGLWTTLDVTPQWRIDQTDKGVSLKGNTYWFVKKRNSPLELIIDRMICFDFTTEQFGPLLPLPFSGSDDLVNLSCVKEEKLAALCYYEFGIEIWLTTMIEPQNMSWSKFLTLDLGFGPYHRIGLQNFSFFIDEVKKVAMLFEKKREYDDGEILEHNFVNIIGMAGDIRPVDLGEIDFKGYDPHVCSYVPSLVQIKQPARDKKIKQSILEKIRFYENVWMIKQYEEEACKKRKQYQEKLKHAKGES